MAKKTLAEAMNEKGFIYADFPSMGKGYYVRTSTIAMVPAYTQKDKLVTVVNTQGLEMTVLSADLGKALGAEELPE